MKEFLTDTAVLILIVVVVFIVVDMFYKNQIKELADEYDDVLKGKNDLLDSKNEIIDLMETRASVQQARIKLYEMNSRSDK